MRNILLTILIAIISFSNAKSQKLDSLIFEEDFLIEEIQAFIDTVKITSIGSGKYNVYVLYIYSNKLSDNMCFTLGYILNSSEYQYIKPQYFFKIKDDFVLVRFHENLNPSNIELNIPTYQKINSPSSVTIVQKLFPSAVGGITGITRGLVYCSDGINSDKVFYDNSDQIPLANSIYASFPNVILELIKEGK